MIRRAYSRIDIGSLSLLLVPLLAIFPLRNNDLWWHLAAGRWMVENRAFPGQDPFSHTEFMGHWVDNEWLAELLFYGSWLLGENAGLILLRAVLFTTIFLLLRAYLRCARRPSVMFPALVVGIAISYSWWALRPSVFSLIGILILIILLERIRHGRREAWLLPCLFLVWANLHPGFFFGLLVLATTAASIWIEPILSHTRIYTDDKTLAIRLSGWTVVSAAAALVNPYGYLVYHQQFVIAQNVRYRELLDEWAPPSVPFLLLVLIAVGAFLFLRYRRVPFPSLVPILGAAALSMTGVRFEEYFALVAASAMLAYLGWLTGRRMFFLGVLVTGSLIIGLLPPMGSAMGGGRQAIGQFGSVERLVQLRDWRNVALFAGLMVISLALAYFGRQSNYRRKLGILWRSGRLGLGSAVIGILLAGALLFLRPLPANGVEPDRYPDVCIAAIPEGSRLFNKLSWGGWLIWNKGVKTFIDGRCWGQPIFFEYLDARSASGQGILEQNQIDTVILPPLDPLIETLHDSKDWSEVCSDTVSVVYRIDAVP